VSELVVYREEVRQALDRGSPVVALESTIIAHGMPFPRNVDTALEVEQIIRDEHCVPATIGIVAGSVRVGLSEAEIREFGRDRDVLKVSRRDFSYALASGKRGATTVCATMMSAHMAGIRVFATGGIGGVHRGVEQSLDISADLLELSQTPVIVVSAGAKAILDLPKTLEYLETHGVPVVGYRTMEFPAFFSRTTGLELDLMVESVEEIAHLYRTQRRLDLKQGILVANPIPEQHEIPQVEIEGFIEQALAQQDAQRIDGKKVTPFLLSRIQDLSGGRSLEANIHLLVDNVRLACGITRELAADL